MRNERTSQRHNVRLINYKIGGKSYIYLVVILSEIFKEDFY